MNGWQDPIIGPTGGRRRPPGLPAGHRSSSGALNNEVVRTGSGRRTLASACRLDDGRQRRRRQSRRWRSLKPNNCGCSSDFSARASSQPRSRALRRRDPGECRLHHCEATRKRLPRNTKTRNFPGDDLLAARLRREQLRSHDPGNAAARAPGGVGFSQVARSPHQRARGCLHRALVLSVSRCQ